MTKILSSVLQRIGRATVSIALAGIVAMYQHNPVYIVLAPVIQGLGKFLRYKWGVKSVPF
jgi:hypothetical protein